MASERQTISCVRCGKSNHDINNFLLECASCKRSWHHTCSLPPVSREELVILIQKMTANKLNPSKEADLWRCRRCMKNLGLAVPRTLPQITPSKAEDNTAVTIPSVSSTTVNVSLHRQQTGTPQPTVAPPPGPSRKGKERAEPMRPLTGAGAIDLTVDSSPPQSNRGQKRPTPNVLVSITSPSPPKKTAWDYRDQPHSLIPTPGAGIYAVFKSCFS
ncbi:hypothetical protein QCA50_006958 [Cerrena zonata]|uniref:PHD-type domain-containing protein n=1 Tax=Cerrena zonata TaxID=2478898 RepID=A0AAW0GL48_9APHY